MTANAGTTPQSARGADVQRALLGHIDLLGLDEVIHIALFAPDHRSHFRRAPQRGVEVDVVVFDVLGAVLHVILIADH